MVKAIEIKLACFIVDHNIAVNVASHLTNLVKSRFKNCWKFVYESSRNELENHVDLEIENQDTDDII